MTRRDMMWRGVGGVLMGGSCIAAQLDVGGAPAILGYFSAALVGIVLMVNGHHVLTVLRAECRGHAMTADAVHAGRVRRRTAQRDVATPGTD